MFLKYTKLALLLSVLFVLITPSISYAIDSRCWTESTCVTGEMTGGVFYKTDETKKACGGEKIMGPTGVDEPVGFCLAAGMAETKVDFAGQNTFSDIGDFIKWFYRYGVVVVSIFAVLVIIFSGFEWATSGGSTEKISSARKRIGGAIMGLFLAVMSYFILNNINPYLVNLRMPQVWMINTSGLTLPYCDQIANKKVSVTKGGSFTLDPKADPANASYCGIDYYVAGTPDLTCRGRYCDSDQVCMNSNKSDPKTGMPIYGCFNGLLGGSIGAPKELFCADLKGNLFDDDLMLIGICSTGDLEEIDKLDLNDDIGENARWYLFGNGSEKTKILKGKINAYEAECNGKGGKLVGFYLGGDLNDEKGGVGGLAPFCNVNSASSGCDDWHAIGKGADGKCNVNLSKVASRINDKKGNQPSCEGPSGIEFCSCASISLNSFVKIMVGIKEFTDYLITKDDLLKGLSCDIFIDRNEFPSLDNKSGVLFCTNLSASDDPTNCFTHQS